MSEITNKNHNLELTLKLAIEDFRKKSSSEMSWKSNCNFNSETHEFLVPFMGKDILVKYPEGIMNFKNSREEVPLIWKILILHYLVRSTGTPLTGNLISYKELPGGDIYFEPFRKRTIIPLIKIFGDNPQKLIEIGKQLGGNEAALGDYSITINVLPNVPITYVLWDGDDEFPPNATVLFDEIASEYLHTEDYAFIASFTVYEMAKM